MSEVIQSEALINILDKRGVISKKELLEEIKRVQASVIKSEA
jgi:glycyl-tRNA synthetase alpha subunit